jgi:hypothetical protein
MKLVWKCDHCCETNLDKDKIELHETKCILNPSNRHCYTCDSHYSFYDSQYCQVHYKGYPHKDETRSYYFKVFEEKIPCKDWSNMKIRNKKLTKIINKINEN